MSRISLWGPTFLSALFLCGSPQFLKAADVTVSPVRLLMVNGKNTVTLKVTNVFDRPTLYHLEPQAWTQEDGRDKSEPTTDILAMPPIFRIGPGKTQIVRIALRRRRDEHRELTYRLFITEVPGETAPRTEGIRTKLRISVPVFVRPEKKALPVVEFSVEKSAEGKLRLTVNNSGKAHILIGRLKLYWQEKEDAPFHDNALSGYVLAARSRSWMIGLSGPIRAEKIVLKAETDDGNKEATLAVLSP